MPAGTFVGRRFRMRLIRAALIFVVSTVFSLSAYADPIRIVDTGPSGPIPTAGASWMDNWLAAEFSVQRSSTITSVQGWAIPMGDPRSGGPVRISLLSGGRDVPGSLLFSAMTSVAGVGPADWIGPSGLSWAVDPGTYWLSFEPLSNVVSGPAFSGAEFRMGGKTNAPLARGAYALLQSNCEFRDRSCWPWHPWPDLDLGVRVFADFASPTPEPRPLVLLALAVLIYGTVCGRKALQSGRP